MVSIIYTYNSEYRISTYIWQKSDISSHTKLFYRL